MGFSYWHRSILIIESLCTQSSYIGIVSDAGGSLRLSAAIYTSAGTSHYLNQMIIDLPVFISSKMVLRY